MSNTPSISTYYLTGQRCKRACFTLEILPIFSYNVAMKISMNTRKVLIQEYIDQGYLKCFTV